MTDSDYFELLGLSRRWHATVRAVVGRDLSAAYVLARRLEPKLAEVAGEDEAGACVDVGGSPWLLLPADASPGLVAHEALHAAVVVAEHVGLPVSAAADEVLCYMIEAIVDAITPWLAAFARAQSEK